MIVIVIPTYLLMVKSFVQFQVTPVQLVLWSQFIQWVTINTNFIMQVLVPCYKEICILSPSAHGSDSIIFGKSVEKTIFIHFQHWIELLFCIPLDTLLFLQYSPKAY